MSPEENEWSDILGDIKEEFVLIEQETDSGKKMDFSKR